MPVDRAVLERLAKGHAILLPGPRPEGQGSELEPMPLWEITPAAWPPLRRADVVALLDQALLQDAGRLTWCDDHELQRLVLTPAGAAWVNRELQPSARLPYSDPDLVN